MEGNDTLIFTGQPDYNSAIGFGGEGPRVSPNMIAQMQNDTARISAQNVIPGQVINRGRGVGNTPMQMPPQQMQQPQMQQIQQPVYNQMQQPQYAQQQQQYVQPQPQYAPQAQYQQPMPQQQDQQYFIEEPYSELVLTNSECHVIVDLPGVAKDKVKINLTQENDLEITFSRSSYTDSIKNTIKGSKGKRPKIDSQINVPEFILGTHTVSYHIPRAVDENNISCTFELGQVHVVLGLRVSSDGIKINVG